MGMGYNMYDKDYGSGFTPENDNRPPEQRPRMEDITSPPRNDYQYYGFQPADEESSNYVPPRPPQKPRKPKKSGGMGTVIALALVCVLLGGAVGAGFMALANSSGSSKSDTAAEDATPDESAQQEDVPAAQENTVDIPVSEREPSTITTHPVAAGGAMTPSQIYGTYANSVVSIEVQTASGIGAGTGFLFTEDGYVLTCYHVVNGYQAISVTFVDSTSYEATYVGGDEDADVAVLKINPEEGTAFQPVVIGDSSKLVVGSNVTAIGNALGTFANTMTTGIVSGLDRALTMSDGTVMNVLQTDCTVNSGNSGGPLFNEYGEVIGIVNAKYSNNGYSSGASVEGIGFAIPIQDAMNIMDDLINHGYITGKPYLGISVATVSSITAQQYSNMVVGAYVRAVNPGSCAETAGLLVGDIITQVNGADITTYEELIDAKNTMRAGDEMNLTVFRDGTYLTMIVTLDEEVPDSAAGDPNEGVQGYDGYGNGDGGNGNYYYGYDPFSDFFGQFFGRGW